MRHVEYPEIAHDIFKRHSHSTSTPLRLTVATQGNFTAVVVCHADGSTSMGISKRHTGDPTLVRYAKALRNCFKNKALQALPRNPILVLDSLTRELCRTERITPTFGMVSSDE
jgi:hypothetical protein